MKKAASRGGLVERPDRAGSDIRSALLSEVVSANTGNVSCEQGIHCVAADTAARFVHVNVMTDAAMQKDQKTVCWHVDRAALRRKRCAAHNEARYWIISPVNRSRPRQKSQTGHHCPS